MGYRQVKVLRLHHLSGLHSLHRVTYLSGPAGILAFRASAYKCFWHPQAQQLTVLQAPTCIHGPHIAHIIGMQRPVLSRWPRLGALAQGSCTTRKHSVLGRGPTPADANPSTRGLRYVWPRTVRDPDPAQRSPTTSMATYVSRESNRSRYRYAQGGRGRNSYS